MPSLNLIIVLYRLSRRFVAVLAVSAVLIIASCGGDDGLGKRYSVSGKVTYNGNPLEKGDISFVSEDLRNNLGATGPITDGSYTLSTGGNDDGAQAGKYKVIITSKEDFHAKAKAAFQKESRSDNAGFIPREFLSKAEAEAKSLIPPGYGDSRTTTLKAEVEPKSNTINFELSDATAPPAPPAPEKGRGRKK